MSTSSELGAIPKPSTMAKHDWYQTEMAVVITILIKNVKNEDLDVYFTSHNVSARVRQTESEDLVFSYNLLHEIVPDQCSYKLTSTKIEIKLNKKEGLRWDKLEGEPVPTASPHVYPTSKGKDWAAIEREMKEQEKSEKTEEEDALNKLFRDIYGKGNDEVKKAMNKSYLESGGTVLSTNWTEISKQKVDIKPPEGMEWKHWDS